MFVRLDGPAERRVEQAMRLEGVDRATAARRLRQLDRTHASCLRHYYGANVHDPGLYHVLLDSTRIELEVRVELLLAAIHSFERWAPARRSPSRRPPVPDPARGAGASVGISTRKRRTDGGRGVDRP